MWVLMSGNSKKHLYTVDRANTLAEGMICQLVRHIDVSPSFLANHVETLFPEGVSRHGEVHFLREDARALAINPMLELLFEHVRKGSFQTRPSRFQSMFAVDDLDLALEFREKYSTYSAPIYRVSAEATFRGDMHLLNAGHSALVTSWLAFQYWNGEAGTAQPFWEWILKHPVEIGERVA